MIALLLMAAQAVPVPRTLPRAVNHQFHCVVFTREREKQELTGTAQIEKRMTWIAQTALTSPGGPFPIGKFRAASNGPNSFAIKALRRGSELTYSFERTSDIGEQTRNGTLQISELIRPGRFAYLATGICDFTSKVQS